MSDLVKHLVKVQEHNNTTGSPLATPYGYIVSCMQRKQQNQHNTGWVMQARRD